MIWLVGGWGGVKDSDDDSESNWKIKGHERILSVYIQLSRGDFCFVYIDTYMYKCIYKRIYINTYPYIQCREGEKPPPSARATENSSNPLSQEQRNEQIE